MAYEISKELEARCKETTRKIHAACNLNIMDDVFYNNQYVIGSCFKFTPEEYANLDVDAFLKENPPPTEEEIAAGRRAEGMRLAAVYEQERDI